MRQGLRKASTAVLGVTGFLIAFQNCSGGGFKLLDGLVENTNLASSTPSEVKVSFASDSPAMLTTDQASFSFSATGKNLTMVSLKCYLDGVAQSMCQSPISLSGMTDADHNLRVTATDQNGLVLADATHSFRVDKTLPVLTVNQSPGAKIGTASTMVSFSATDNFSNVMTGCSLDNAAYITCTSPFALSNLVQGPHTLRIYARDAAGNTSAVQAVSFSVVLGVPTVGLSQTPAAFSNSATASFSFMGVSANSTISKYECSINGQAYAACTSPKSYSGLTEGAQVFAVRATDALGEVSSPVSYNFKVDITKPTVPVVNSNLMNPSKQTSLDLAFTSTDASGIASYECRMDGGSFAACTSPKSFMALSIASHTFGVRAKDVAGNISDEGTYTIIIDNVAPVVSITSKPDTSSSVNSASFAFIATDTLSGINLIECQLDNQMYEVCTSPKMYSNLTIGNHTFNLRASDKAGNSTVQSASWMVTAMVTPTPTPEICTEDPTPAVAPMQRLTKIEYNNVIRDLFGLTGDFSANFTAETVGGLGFTTEGKIQTASPDMVNDFWNASIAVADAVFKLSPNPFMTCTTVGDTCARKNITYFTTKAYRRPATTAEIDRLMLVYKASSSTAFADAMKLTLQAILMSPQFIFRTYDLPANSAVAVALTDYEMASRLSFFIWGSIPDDSLRVDAAAGRLKDTTVLETQVRRMLKDTRAKYLQKSFANQWLKLSPFNNSQLSTSRFPNWNTSLRDSMKKETEYFLDNVFYGDQSVMDIINGGYTFLDQRLGSNYSVAGITTDTFTKVTSAASKGLLTQGSFLVMTSGADHTTPVRRGKWILDVILCSDPGSPPPGIPALPTSNNIAFDESQIRERMAAHTQAGSTCIGCHRSLDPIGYAFENYNSIGAYRSQYLNGVAVNASGELPTGEKVNGLPDLVNVLKEDPRYRRCFTKKLLSFAQGRDATTFAERCVPNNLADKAVGPQYKFSDAVLGVVKSNSFRNRTVSY